MDDQPMLVKHHAYSRHGLLLSLCCALGCSIIWRAELAGCAQRDSAKPVKQSGVREGQRWGRSPFHVLYPCLSLGFAAGARDRKLPSPSRIGCLQHGASRLHSLGTRAAAVVSRDDGMGSLREKPELMSLDNHNKPDKDDSFTGVVHALKDLSFE